MRIRPGYFTPNLIGKQAGAPADTPANVDSSYVFSTGNVTVNGVTLVKRTGNGGSGLAWTNPTYDNTSEIMTFDGTTQAVAYASNTNLHVNPPPFSLQVDFNTDRVNTHQYIINLGQGNGVGWPEFIVDLNSTTLSIQSSGNNLGNQLMSFNISTGITAGVWYRVGCMVYITGTSTVNLRCYLNSEVKVQTVMTYMPYQSTQSGLAIGNDNANTASTFFKGQIRNFYIGKTQFWDI